MSVSLKVDASFDVDSDDELDDDDTPERSPTAEADRAMQVIDRLAPDKECLVREYGPFERFEAAREGMARHVGSVRDQAHPHTDFSDCNASACALEMYKRGALAPMSVEASKSWAQDRCASLINGSMDDDTVIGIAIDEVQQFNKTGLEPSVPSVLDVFLECRDSGQLEA